MPDGRCQALKLTPEDTACFYDVFFKLIDYTNEKYQVVPALKKTSGAINVDPAAMMLTEYSR